MTSDLGGAVWKVIRGNLRKDVRPEVRAWAVENRHNPAPGEAELWERVRAKRLGFRFRRQAVIRGWIADFWCPAKRLVIEVDGASHHGKLRRLRDLRRDKALSEKLGIKTLRFPLMSVLIDLNAVVDQIRHEIKSRPTAYIRFAVPKEAGVFKQTENGMSPAAPTSIPWSR